jgi:hypothetical protein
MNDTSDDEDPRAALARLVAGEPKMIGHLPFELQQAAMDILERRRPSRAVTRRPPIACGHSSAHTAWDEAGVKICVSCTGEGVAGFTLRKGQVFGGRFTVVDLEPGVAVHYQRKGDLKTYGQEWSAFVRRWRCG